MISILGQTISGSGGNAGVRGFTNIPNFPVVPIPVTPIEWYWWTLAGSAVLAGTLIVLWALLWDRARGRQRCPKCWYDMAGQKAQRDEGTEGRRAECWRCPECGRLIRKERKLRKTRRRWRWALAAFFFLVIAPPSAVMIQASRIGFWQAVPDWALIRIVERQGWPEPSGTLQAGPSVTFVAPRGTFASVAGTGRHTNSQDELFARLITHNLSDRATERIFSAAVTHILETREQWPAGLRIYAKVSAPAWADVVSQGELTIEYVEHEGKRIWIRTVNRTFRPLWDFDVLLEPLAVNPNGVRLRGVLDVRDVAVNGRFAGKRLEHEFVQRVDAVESVDNILTPIDDPKLTDWLRDHLRIRLVRFHQQDPQLLIWFGDEVLQAGIDGLPPIGLVDEPGFEFGELSLGFTIEFRRDGEVLDRVRTWANVAQIAGGHQAKIDNPSTPLRAGGFYPGEWTLHIIGDGEMGLRDFDKDKYWGGEFSIPMSEVEVVRTGQ